MGQVLTIFAADDKEISARKFTDLCARIFMNSRLTLHLLPRNFIIEREAHACRNRPLKRFTRIFRQRLDGINRQIALEQIRRYDRRTRLVIKQHMTVSASPFTI